MEEIIVRVLQFFLSLSILVVLHELGHFLPAKFFGARVEKFYMFFDYKFSLLKFKKGDTEYGIGWIPLGGYVKISGMVDESMDTEQLKSEPQPWEFRSKPAWQRLIILMGGVTVNAILAFFIYVAIMFVWGEKFLPNDNVKDGIWVTDSLMMDLGFKTGDRIVDIDGKKIERFSGLFEEMLYAEKVHVKRANGEDAFLHMPEGFAGRVIEEERMSLFTHRMPFIIGEVPDSGLNVKAGFKKRDLVLSVGGKPIKYLDEYFDIANDFAGQKTTIAIERQGEGRKNIEVQFSDEGRIGLPLAQPKLGDLAKMGYYELEVHHYTFLESFPAGWRRTTETFNSYLRQFKLMFTPSSGAYKGIGSFLTIGSMFPGTWDWQVFWNLTAFLSIMLAILNLLPIPALDGGHVMFTLYELFTGKKPGDKFMEYAQMVGLIILLSLFLFAIGNDVRRFW